MGPVGYPEIIYRSSINYLHDKSVAIMAIAPLVQIRNKMNETQTVLNIIYSVHG